MPNGPLTGPPPYYAASYCEENVWHLLADPALAALEQAHAVFISNAQRCVPVWCQRAALHASQPVMWDYHVVAWGQWGGRGVVLDLDSTLPFPSADTDWLAAAFPQVETLPPEYLPAFRLVDAATFHSHFASDRSHMRGPDGSFTAPPPPAPSIATAHTRMNLWDYVNMGPSPPGVVLTLAQLLERWQSGALRQR